MDRTSHCQTIFLQWGCCLTMFLQRGHGMRCKCWMHSNLTDSSQWTACLVSKLRSARAQAVNAVSELYIPYTCSVNRFSTLCVLHTHGEWIRFSFSYKHPSGSAGCFLHSHSEWIRSAGCVLHSHNEWIWSAGCVLHTRVKKVSCPSHTQGVNRFSSWVSATCTRSEMGQLAVSFTHKRWMRSAAGRPSQARGAKLVMAPAPLVRTSSCSSWESCSTSAWRWPAPSSVSWLKQKIGPLLLMCQSFTITYVFHCYLGVLLLLMCCYLCVPLLPITVSGCALHCYSCLPLLLMCSTVTHVSISHCYLCYLCSTVTHV